MEEHVFVSQGLCDEGRNYPNILPRDTTGNETWGCCYDPETRVLSEGKPSLTSKENEVNQVKNWNMLVACFNFKALFIWKLCLQAKEFTSIGAGGIAASEGTSLSKTARTVITVRSVCFIMTVCPCMLLCQWLWLGPHLPYLPSLT